MARSDLVNSSALRSTALAAFGLILVGQGMDTRAVADSLFVRDRNVSVLEREREEYAALGIRAGQFILKPRLDLGVGYTSNAFAISNVPVANGADEFEEESDIYGFIRPSLGFETTWSRHAIAGGVYTEIYQNARFDTETIANYGAFLNGQADLTRQAAVFGGVSYDLLHESRRVNNSAVLFVEPVEYTLARGHLGLKHELGRVRYSGRIDLARYDYDDVEIVPITDEETFTDPIFQDADQDFRDRDDWAFTGQVGLAVTRDLAVFGRAIYNFQEYEQETDLNGRSRDSEGWTLAAGAEFDITNLMRGAVAVGYFEQDYEDDAFADLDGVSVDAALEWFPRERTTVTLTGRRAADESALVAEGGYVTTEAILRVDQEIKRNILGYALLGAGQQDFSDSVDGQTIDRWGAGAGGTYFFNRNLSTSLDYSYESQLVEQNLFEGGFDTDYDVHELIWTVTLKR